MSAALSRHREQLGQKLRALREKRGLTVAQAADALGCTERAVRYWEVGHSFPRTPEMWKLCGVYGVTFESLLGGILEDV
jgi:transcriptional regulator with XRE-family HTH domain